MDEGWTTSLGERITNQWSLRDELLASAHRWPLILLYFLVGSLLGFCVSLVWPSPYRATTELYVGIQIHRALQDQNTVEVANGVPFNYADDYKNWQMANLNTLVYLDETSRETLDRLRLQDDYWLGVSRQELAGMLRVHWRNAGRWRLIAEHLDQQRAVQAVAIWQEVILERVQSSVANAQETMGLYTQIQSNAAAQAQAAARSIEVAQARDSLQAWQATASQWPAEQVVSDEERWQAWAPIEQADPGSEWQSLRESFPPSGASTSQYLAWTGQALALLQQELEVSQAQADTFSLEQVHLLERYEKASRESLGFSAELVVEPVNSDTPAVSVLRPVALLALLGGLFGLTIWVVVWLARISLRKNR